MKRRFIFSVVMIAGVLCANSQTRVSGVISKDTRWNAEYNPYIVTDDIFVPSHVRLLIDPGVTVVVASRPKARAKLAQFDRLDSQSISIRVMGTLICEGTPGKRISFAPEAGQRNPGSGWYGIIFDKAEDPFTEIAFTDIAGAYNGITINNCSPVIRNTILEYNNIGVNCLRNGTVNLYNCVIAHNLAAGIRVVQANPRIENSIIVFNRNNGVWCDGLSKINFQYNCVYGNADGDFLDCDPELGIVLNGKHAKDSVDYAHNLCRDPIFAGSPGDSLAVEHDINLPTDKSRVRDTAVAKVLYTALKDSSAVRNLHTAYKRYELSRYSPCVNAGDPGHEFRNSDESRNTMGIYGGQEFSAVKN